MLPWQAAALAISIFNAIICLWLGSTVILDGGRERGPQLAAAGMVMAGVFFLIHAAVVGRGPPLSGVGLPFWWRVISVPSLLAPYAWYATMVWYTGVSGRVLTMHKLLLVVVGLFIGVLVLLLTAIYPLPPQVRTFALRIVPAWLVAGLPFIVAGYLLTLIICFVLPIHALLTGPGRRANLPSQAWGRVRTWLVRTSLLGLLGGLIALGGAVVVFSVSPNLQQASNTLTRLFFQFDVTVLLVVAAALGAAGQAVGAYAAFTERPLPQWSRIDQWRWLLVIAALFALIVGVSAALGVDSIYILLFATTLAALAYALLSWRYRIEHEAFMDRLRPFVSSLHFQDRLLDGGTSLSVAVAGLVEAVSRDVLRAERACLILRDTIPGLPPAVAYQWGAAPAPSLDELPIPDSAQRSGLRLDPGSGAEWAIPLWDGRGLAGALVLGAPVSGSVYSEELMEVAAACCARLTDALAGERAARMLADVLRQRIAEVKVLGSQGRRTLHDDVLPHIHAALIHLSAMPNPDSTATEAIGALSNAHRELSALIRTLPPATPHRLEHVGLAQTLHDLATLDFGAAFDSVSWQIAPGVEPRLVSTPQFVGEVVSYAVQEALRNAARHARGADSRRPLPVTIAISWNHGLVIEIADDGVGMQAAGGNGGAGAGLRLHRGLLAVLGGTFQASSPPAGGTSVRLFVPEDLWSLAVLAE
jgi:signal transduction histidine kinase